MTLTASSVVEQKKHLLEHEVSTSAWKSPFQLKEWFCTVDLNLKKNKTNDADTLIYTYLNISKLMPILPEV